MNATPRRHWCQFSLRTMFVVVVVVSIPLGWVGYSLNWIRQRHEMVEGSPQRVLGGMVFGPPHAPFGLWLFGEEGYGHLAFIKISDEELDIARRLFPEAIVSGPTSSPDIEIPPDS